DEYIIGAIGRAARETARPRKIILIAENERQEAKLILPREKGGDDLDAVWNDDFHHSAVVNLTGKREAYYSDYLGTPQEFISAAKYGYLFQGHPHFWLSSPPSPPKKCRNDCRSLPIRPSLSVPNSILPSAKKTKNFTICMSIFCGCAGKTRVFASRNRAAWTAQCLDRPALFSAISATATPMTDYWW